MNTNKISITAFSSISPLGNNAEEVWTNYLNENHCFSKQFLDQQETSTASLSEESKKLVAEIRESDPKYKFLDDSVLFALAASRKAVQKAGWNSEDAFGINIGSSRGATDLFEKHYKEYIDTGKAQTLASPTTTLGNISSWIAHDLQSTGPEISHSITCSTALHALLNGFAWLKSGMADKFLVGGSEAPLTDFTIAQMRALKIYSRIDQDQENWPNLAFDFEKTQNTMILGEGAAVCCLEAGETENAIAYVTGVGYATEVLEHNISISAEATCFQKSMKMALKEEDLESIDAIVMHAPGTIKGDLTELRAIEKVFGEKLPLLTTNKWKIGHTFGASGILSLELALLMMQHDTFVGVPFGEKQHQNKAIKKVLINAVGFGGNAVSVLIEKR
ncbi:beta-ketoacyl synthase N-terminal-like domain-containing protein [Flavobacterium sp. LHD-80]|uniref:beta-ketoacyl synthase N-terminal-like domain-containing protein n=1 Tax=Flavobacterium sp. LHD-80 TaxID=3071411 RepID=UPI0027E1A9A1|nr:beta-ketoacyl synthase N-terminal-like domain-containing protein [Flavobacterium sp. LHD-80]MDQ6471267.1 beta-ketoacyl synthase N-terminal-like domain-containing protein [Flavobacterium sp. LHD-80]